MDEEGRINRNRYDVLAGPGHSADLGPGEVCRFQDTEGNHVLDLIIGARGHLILRRPIGQVYSLRPDPRRGPAHAVSGYRGDEAICRAMVRDDPEKGIFRYRLEILRDGHVIETFEDGYRYDPFTARVLGPLEPRTPCGNSGCCIPSGRLEASPVSKRGTAAGGGA